MRRVQEAYFPAYAPTLPNVIREAVSRFASNRFFVEPDREATFAEVEERSARLAVGLLALGVGKATRVAIVMPNGIDWVTSWWAAARAGALTLPLSTMFRPRELDWALRHADVDTLLIQARYLGNDYVERLEEAIPDLAGQASKALRLRSHPYLRRIVVWGRSDLPGWAMRGPQEVVEAALSQPGMDRDFLAAAEAQITAADLLVGICTSGSTAQPKIVVHSHGSAIRLSHTLRRTAELREDDRSYTGMPFFWLGGINNLLQTVFEGACLVISPSSKADDVIETLVRHRVTRVTAWPPQIAAIRSRARALGVDLSFVKRGLYPPRDAEGNPIPAGRYCFAQLGMTECFGPHGMEAPTTVLPPERAGSVGHSVEGIERRVVDSETGDVLPPGEVGELQIRGWSMMDGYYKRERGEVFLPDGWFPTGDRLRIDEAGYAYFHGRVSEMIKTSGANVSPAEIEALLQGCEGVREAFVVGVPDAVKGERVEAVVVAKEGVPLDLRFLLARARDELSPYKVPARIHVMSFEEIPRTDAGKVRKPELKNLLAQTKAPGAAC